MRIQLLVLTAALLAVGPAAVHARDANRRAPDTVTVTSPEQAVAAALLHSPGLRAAAATQQASRGDRLQAPLRPNPEASLVVENFGGLGGRGEYRGGRAVETTLGISQRVELGGKRQARIGVAEVGTTVADLDYSGARLDLSREVVTALADAVAAKRAVEIELERARLADETLRVARGRVEAGREPLVQVRRAEVTRATATVAVERARQEADASLANLAVLMGVTHVELAPRQAWFTEIGPRPRGGTPAAANDRVAGNPDLARLDAVVAQRRADLALQRANAVPDVTLQGYVRRFEEGRETTFVAGAAIPLPLSDRNQGGIARAVAELNRAEAEADRGRLAATASLAAAERRLELAWRAAQSLQRDVVPAAEQGAGFASGGYAAGRFGFLEVLDAQRTLSDARAQLNDAFRDFHARRAEVNRLSGREAGSSQGRAP